MRKISSVLASVALFGFGTVANAATANTTPGNLVQNGSFNYSTAPASTMPWVPDGWTLINPAPYALNYNSLGQTRYESWDGGTMFGSQQVQANTPSVFGAGQTISNLVLGQAYTLSFAQNISDNTPGMSGNWLVSFGSQSFNSATSVVQPADSYGYTLGGWTNQSMTFTATATSQVLTFASQFAPGVVPSIMYLDGVVLTAPVPEPSSYALMLLGLAGLGVLVKRQRRA